jgi:hypothetical protein
MMYRITKKYFRKFLKNIFFKRKDSKVYYHKITIKRLLYSSLIELPGALSLIGASKTVIFERVIFRFGALFFRFLIIYNNFVDKAI